MGVNILVTKFLFWDNSYNRWGNEQLNRMDIYQLMHTTKYSRISEDDTTVG